MAVATLTTNGDTLHAGHGFSVSGAVVSTSVDGRASGIINTSTPASGVDATQVPPSPGIAARNVASGATGDATGRLDLSSEHAPKIATIDTIKPNSLPMHKV